MIYIKNRDEIEQIRESNQIVAETLLFIKDYIKPGVSTGELNKEIENFILKKKAKPAFKGLYGFPASSCISIQDEVVHGIPSFKRYLKEGEIDWIDLFVNPQRQMELLLDIIALNPGLVWCQIGVVNEEFKGLGYASTIRC